MSIHASISASPTKPNVVVSNPKLCTSFSFSKLSSLPFPSHSQSFSLCRCSNANRGWDSILHDVVSSSINLFNSHLNSLRRSSSIEDEPERDWDWDRWLQHFHDIDEQEHLLSILKLRLGDAVRLEDYEDAAKLKVAIAAAATNDTVGMAMSLLNKAIEEERYSDAAFLRDEAGAGLVGWWAGISKDIDDPYGLIIRITPEHGRYVARSYNPRMLATSAAGVPVFEIFITKNRKGEFQSQAVHLKRRGDPPKASPKALDTAKRLRPLESPEDRSELSVVRPEDPEDVDDRNDKSDSSQQMPGFQNVFKDMIPSVKIIEDEEDEDKKEDEDADADADEDEDVEKDNEIEILELEDINSETVDEIEINSNWETFESEEQNEVADKVVIGGLAQKFSSRLTTVDLLRVPAKLETSVQGSFSFTVENVVNQQDVHTKVKPSSDKSTKIQGQHSVDHVMSDLAKFIGRGKVPSELLKDVANLISLTLSQPRKHQRLSGSTIFNRIEIPTSPDLLNGLYIGTLGIYSSEIIQLRHRYGHWQEDDGANEPSDLEFYEYVEAFKLTGDPYVPAGQVAFRAKVGKRYQLPHKGIIPEELGLIARYKGQGRLAEPGFQNPQWVDGELLILNGKYIKTGPVVGFLYRAPEFRFLVFFNQLRLQQ